MIQRLSHSTVFVFDQDQARKFYVEVLGFELKMDFDLGEFRWLTVSPRGQPDLQLVLMPVVSPEVRELVAKGSMPTGVFRTADCRRTYEELSAKGVEFSQPPTDRFFGVEAVFKDPFGNRFNLTGPKPEV